MLQLVSSACEGTQNVIGYWLLSIEYWLLISDYWFLIVDYWWLSIEHWLLTIHYWVLIIDYWLLVIDYWLLIIDYWWLIIDYWLLIIVYWLLIIEYWLFIIDYWLFTSMYHPWAIHHAASIILHLRSTLPTKRAPKNYRKQGETTVFFWILKEDMIGNECEMITFAVPNGNFWGPGAPFWRPGWSQRHPLRPLGCHLGAGSDF